MPWKRIALSFALLVFLFLTVRAVQAHSYWGVIMMFSANPATDLLSADLIISLTLISIWMIVDARKNGNSWIPFLEITFFFGIAGPLLYLITRDFSLKVQRIEAFVLLIALTVYSLLNFSSPQPSQPLSQLPELNPETTQAFIQSGIRMPLHSEHLNHAFTPRLRSDYCARSASKR